MKSTAVKNPIKRLLTPLLLFFAVTILLPSCKKHKLTPKDNIANVWINKDSLATSNDPDTLAINKSETFFIRYQSGKKRKGNWSLEKDRLVLRFFPPDMQLDIDSMQYTTHEGTPSITYFHQGEKVATHSRREIEATGEVKTYEVGKVSKNKLLLNKNGASLFFESAYKKVKPGFEFNIISILRGLLGIASLLAIAFLFSTNRKAISWSLVGKGLLIQFVFAIGVLKVPFIETFFEMVSSFFVTVISFTQDGTEFLFKSFVTGKIESALVNFVVQVLPTIIFFSALTSLFYYWGILQKLVYGFAWMMKKLMKLSGAESLAAAGNIFLGQTESPLLVKPYLDSMSKSEIMCLMSGGMATIAGGVLAAYIGFLGGDDPVQQIFFAKHLLAASVMSAPAAVVAAKILVPETEAYDKQLKVSKEKIGGNALEAIANGTTQGLKLAVNVGAMLLVFIALMSMGNYILRDMIGSHTGVNEWIVSNTNFDGLSFEFIIGYAFAPIAWLMGVAKEDMVLVGQLLGEKTILNEFVAYVSLGKMKSAHLFAEQKSITMATYILCGFANFASIGIQIGGIGSLAPKRKGLLAKYGFRALIAGTLASLFTAVIVGMLV